MTAQKVNTFKMSCRSQYEPEEDVMEPNETLYGSLKDGRRKRPSDQKQKNLALLAKFWPNSAVCSFECVSLGQRSHL